MAVIASPITGQKVDALNVNEVMGLLYEDLARLISGADIELRYPEMERSYGEWGGMIKEGRVPAADGTVVDPETNEICGPFYFDIDSRYYQTWTEASYPSEVRRVDLTKILRGEEDYQDMLRRVAQRNIEGYRKDVNKSIDGAFVASESNGNSKIKALLGAALQNDSIAGALSAANGWLNPPSSQKQRYEILDEGTTYAQLWSEVLRTCKHMLVENSDYTEGDAVYGCRREDLTIWAPIDLMAGTSIQYLQGLYRLDGMDQLPKIREHNGLDMTIGDKKYGAIFVMDNRVLNHVQRYMGYDSADIICRKSNMIDLHVEHMVKYSPLYKAWAIVFEYPQDASESAVLVNVV